MTDPALLPFDRLIAPCLRKHDVATQSLLIEAISPTVAFILLGHMNTIRAKLGYML